MPDIGHPFANPITNVSISLARSASTNSVAAGVTGTVIWTTAIMDNSEWWSSSVDPTRITFNYSGSYLVIVRALPTIPGSSCHIGISTNGGGTSNEISVNTGVNNYILPIAVNEGDYIEITYRNNSASPGYSLANSFLTILRIDV